MYAISDVAGDYLLTVAGLWRPATASRAGLRFPLLTLSSPEEADAFVSDYAELGIHCRPVRLSKGETSCLS